MRILLWLDDIRNPFEEARWPNVFSPIKQPFNVVWVKSYDEFVKYILEHGLPDGICFDHDLADEHYGAIGPLGTTDFLNWDEYYVRQDREYTGYDCAKWLINYCKNGNLKLPPYNIQSANPVGKENIHKLLKNYIDNEDMAL